MKITKNIYLVFIMVNILMIKCAYPQTNKDKNDILESINLIRSELKLGSFDYDSSISNSIIEFKIFLLKDIDKDTLRQILRKHYNYDYNIEYIEFTAKNTKDLNLKFFKNNHKKLYETLKDSLYNRIGCNVINFENTDKIQLIITKNYVNFYIDKINISIPAEDISNPERTPNPTLLIKGNSNITDLYFSKVSVVSLDNLNENKLVKKKVELSSNKDFEITEEYKDEHFIFYNSKGEILSYYSYFIIL